MVGNFVPMQRAASVTAGSQGTSRRRAATALLGLVLWVALAAGAAGTVTAADSEAPTWGNATRGNATTIAVTIYDNGTLDEGTITADDFLLSQGVVENVTVTTLDVGGSNRTGVRVDLHLDSRLNVDSVDVALRSGASITDEAGNELPDGTVTVTGMDSMTPRYRGFEVHRVNTSTVELQVRVNEVLGNLTLSIAGPTVDTLSIDAFTADVAQDVVYTGRYTFPEEGEYSLLLLDARDRSDNSIRYGKQRTFRYDGSAPTVVLEGPGNATVGEEVTFTARNSTDEWGIERYRWRIDGGTLLPGETVTVAFASPGAHELALEVTDPAGNTALATTEIQVSGTGLDGHVNLSRVSEAEVVANVTTSGTSQRIRDPRGSLVTARNGSLDRVRATFAENDSVDLSIRANDRTPPSFATATGEAGLFSLDLDHGDGPASDVTFTFAVARTALETVGAEPAAVTLYRDEAGWVPLETAVVSRSDDRVVYQAVSPGLSTFVVGTGRVESETEPEPKTEISQETSTDEATTATESETRTAPGRSNIVVTDVTVTPERPAAGDQAVMAVELANRGNATGDFLVAVFLNDSLLTSREVTVPAGETRTTEFARALPTAGTLEVAGRSVANVSAGGGGSLLPSVSLPVPNPLALWPGGIAGTVLSGVVGFVAVLYLVLKSLAIYLGY